MSDIKIKDIISKLKNLGCSVIDSCEDDWIKEILFKPNNHRYHLIEWIFNELKFNIPKDNEFRNNSEIRTKNLLSGISKLGLCQKDNSAVIEGVAPMKEQLDLWKHLIDILWLHRTLLTGSNGFPDDEYKSETVDERLSSENESSCSYISTLCEAVDFNHLFNTNVELFPPYIMKEANDLEKNCPRNCLKGIGLHSSIADFNDAKSEVFSPWNERSTVLDETLSAAESDIADSLAKVQYCVEGFNSTYDTLKLNLNVASQKSPDFTSAFKSAKRKTDIILEMKKSLASLKTLETKLESVMKEVSKIRISDDELPVSDTLLKDFTTILYEEKKMKDILT